jgi:hypothetical protein
MQIFNIYRRFEKFVEKSSQSIIFHDLLRTVSVYLTIYFLCNGGQHYVPYRWLLISNKLCDSTLCTCGGVGGGEGGRGA